MQVDWRDLTYLAHGTRRQMVAYRALRDLGVFGLLHSYDPLLAGTFPLDIDIEGSDFDIICEVHNLDTFGHLVEAAFGERPGFYIARKVKRDIPTVVVSFSYEAFPVEIFGQPRAVI